MNPDPKPPEATQTNVAPVDSGGVNSPAPEVKPDSLPPKTADAPGGSVAPSTPQGAPSTQNVGLEQTLTWYNEDGTTRQATLEELTQAKIELERMKGSGYDLYERAIQGDQEAARQFLVETLGRTPDAVDSTKPDRGPDGKFLPDQPKPEQAKPEGWDEVLAFFSELRNEKIREGIDKLIQTRDEFEPLRKRPNIVDNVIEKLHLWHTQGYKVGEEQMYGIMKKMATDEAEYRKSLISSVQGEAGSLGVNDPFRGGPPEILAKPRPDPVKERPDYNKWFDAKMREAVQKDRNIAEAARSLAESTSG